MRVAVNNHALPVHKKIRVTSLLCIFETITPTKYPYINCTTYFKETKSATMKIFDFFYFLFKSFVKVELSYVFTINPFTIAENCTEK